MPDSPLLRPCRTPDALHAWVRLFTNLDVPRTPVCPGHDAPFDYLLHSYFEPTSDLVVWAPRGGGKTRLAAVATLLDLLHKPGAQIRILGGSLEQSLKMWDYLLPDLDRLARKLLTRRLRDSARRVRLAGGGDAAVLTQSQRAVRGLRVQKLRCDEVELFDPDVWEAAQLVTRSQTRQGKTVSGAVEALSTLHAAHGLMGRVVARAEAGGTRVVRWCLLDVLQRCEAGRPCEGCPLWDDCGGRAKTLCDGFVSIDDAIRMKGRVSREMWDCEILCRRPSTRGRVFPGFEPQLHVRPWDAANNATAAWSLGVDFGFSNPFVALWVARTPGGAVHVVDEHVRREWTLGQHLAEIARRPWPKVARVHCDPAGAGRSGQTAASDVSVLRSAGYVVRHRPSRIAEGLELLRAALRPASGAPRLFVDPRCVRLVAALQGYRYPPDAGGESPLKDGTHDHPIDALRYDFINTLTGGPVRVSRY